MERIIHGDCLDVLKEIPDNSVDAVVTDPPYGLSKEPDIREVLTKWMNGEDYHHRGGGFMGKTWDSFVPGPSIWREVYRVLKPGGHVLCFAGTRTQDLMTISLRLAGFEIRDVIEWLYFSGFPKSMDVGKQLDKKAPRRGLFDAFAAHFDEKLKASGLSRSDLVPYFPHYKNAESIKAQVSNWRLGKNVPTKKDFEILRNLIGLSDDWQALIDREEAEREKIGEGNAGLAKGESRRNGSHKVGYRKTYDITAPATNLAKQWDGWGTALKPAHEPIILARKPIEKNVAYNVEKYGTGAINIDGCRIPYTNENEKWKAPKVSPSWSHMEGGGGWKNPQNRQDASDKGRFPANCITTEPDMFYSKYFNITPPELSKKASKKDRNSTWDGRQIDLEEKTTDDGRKKPIDNPYLRGKTKRLNSHPTVKPTDLMAWLIRLITPPGGTVLDPFAGSGSTLVAAKREGFSFIGIEKEAEYIEIAKARVGVKAWESGRREIG